MYCVAYPVLFIPAYTSILKVVRTMGARFQMFGVRKLFLLLGKGYTNYRTSSLFINYLLIRSTRFLGSIFYVINVPNRNHALFGLRSSNIQEGVLRKKDTRKKKRAKKKT